MDIGTDGHRHGWTCRRTDIQTDEHMTDGHMTIGHMTDGHMTDGHMTDGHIDRWTYRHMDKRTDGHTDEWTYGRMTNGQKEPDVKKSIVI